MKSKKNRLAMFLATAVFILGFQLTAVSASMQVCLTLSNPPGFAGSGPVTLTLGVMDYGNGHYGIAGTEQFTLVTNPPATVVSPLHGNAELIGGQVEISLTGTSISGSLQNTSYHLVIDPATLNGIYKNTENGVASREGSALVTPCSVEEPQSISFKPNTGNYFLVNSYNVSRNPTFFVIRNFNSFNSLFNWAATMGQDSTQIISQSEMQTNFVLAIVSQGAYSTDIAVQSVNLQSEVLSVYYTTTTPIPHPAWIANNLALILVPNCNYSSINFYENNQLVNNPFVENR